MLLSLIYKTVHGDVQEYYMGICECRNKNNLNYTKIKFPCG